MSIPQNSSLTSAHSRYSSAQANPDVTNLAPIELKDASDYLAKADNALNQGDGDDKVNQLAYAVEGYTDSTGSNSHNQACLIAALLPYSDLC